jgi:hypothetical protein
VRPHPQRPLDGRRLDLSGERDAALWPPPEARVLGLEARETLFDSIFHAAAVVGSTPARSSTRRSSAAPRSRSSRRSFATPRRAPSTSASCSRRAEGCSPWRARSRSTGTSSPPPSRASGRRCRTSASSRPSCGPGASRSRPPTPWPTPSRRRPWPARAATPAGGPSGRPRAGLHALRGHPSARAGTSGAALGAAPAAAASAAREARPADSEAATDVDTTPSVSRRGRVPL